MKNTTQDPTVSTDPRLAGVVLRSGAGETVESGMCVMQAVAWLAGEVKDGHLTDAPECACPLIRRFLITINDRWDQDNRQKLLALVPLIVGSRSTLAVQKKRAYVFADHAIRIVLPWLCAKLGLAAEGEQLRALSVVTDKATAELARQAALSVRNIFRTKRDAYAAAYAAAAAADAAAAYAAYAAAAYAAAAAAYAAYADADADADAYAAAAADAAAAAAAYAAAAAAAYDADAAAAAYAAYAAAAYAAAAATARSELADFAIATVKAALAITE